MIYSLEQPNWDSKSPVGYYEVKWITNIHMEINSLRSRKNSEEWKKMQIYSDIAGIMNFIYNSLFLWFLLVCISLYLFQIYGSNILRCFNSISSSPAQMITSVYHSRQFPQFGSYFYLYFFSNTFKSNKRWRCICLVVFILVFVVTTWPNYNYFLFNTLFSVSFIKLFFPNIKKLKMTVLEKNPNPLLLLLQ